MNPNGLFGEGGGYSWIREKNRVTDIARTVDDIYVIRTRACGAR